MSNNIIKKIANSVAGTAFSLALIAASRASAITSNFYFQNSLNTQIFGGGSLSFDDAYLTGNGSEELKLGDLANANFNWDFNYLSSNLNESHIVGQTTFIFADGVITGIIFLADKQNTISGTTETLSVGAQGFNFFQETPVGEEQVSGQVNFETVTAWQPPDPTDPTDPTDVSNGAGAPYEFSPIPGLVLLGAGYGVNYLWKRWKDKDK
ncbi:MAG: hypothetical protein AB4352_09245 [Hormoscilla sp.]